MSRSKKRKHEESDAAAPPSKRVQHQQAAKTQALAGTTTQVTKSDAEQYNNDTGVHSQRPSHTGKATTRTVPLRTRQAQKKNPQTAKVTKNASLSANLQIRQDRVWQYLASSDSDNLHLADLNNAAIRNAVMNIQAKHQNFSVKQALLQLQSREALVQRQLVNCLTYRASEAATAATLAKKKQKKAVKAAKMTAEVKKEQVQRLEAQKQQAQRSVAGRTTETTKAMTGAAQPTSAEGESTSFAEKRLIDDSEAVKTAQHLSGDAEISTLSHVRLDDLKDHLYMTPALFTRLGMLSRANPNLLVVALLLAIHLHRQDHATYALRIALDYIKPKLVDDLQENKTFRMPPSGEEHGSMIDVEEPQRTAHALMTDSSQRKAFNETNGYDDEDAMDTSPDSDHDGPNGFQTESGQASLVQTPQDLSTDRVNDQEDGEMSDHDDLNTSSDMIKLWQLNHDDQHAQRRYFLLTDPNEVVKCLACGVRGHTGDKCPARSCSVCNTSNHPGSLCPKHHKCERCRKRGHPGDTCREPTRMAGALSTLR